MTQINGNTNAGSLAEVEANTKALRVNIRPNDYGVLGAYSDAAASGTMAAGLAGNSPVWSCRFNGASNLALVKKVIISAGNTATAFTAGVVTFQLFPARSYSVNDTGGTAIAPGTGGNKKRTANMGSTGMADIRISSTGTLTAGTRTLDAQPLASISTSIVAVAGTTLLVPTAIFEARVGEYPWTLAVNEGLVLQATVPATGTWQLSVTLDWEEVVATTWY